MAHSGHAAPISSEQATSVSHRKPWHYLNRYFAFLLKLRSRYARLALRLAVRRIAVTFGVCRVTATRLLVLIRPRAQR